MVQPRRLGVSSGSSACPSCRRARPPWVYLLLAAVSLAAMLLPLPAAGAALPPARQAAPAAPGRAAGGPHGLALRPALQAATPTPTLTATPTSLEDLANQLDAAWNAANWPQAILLIEAIIRISPTYDDIQSKYYFAYVNWGYQLLTNGDCLGSQAKFRRALELRPDGQEAQAGLDMAARYCVTPVPSGTITVSVTPGPGPTPTDTPPAGTPAPQPASGPITYTVQPHDTLFSLAKRYNTTVQAIMQANGMMSYQLQAGSTITIPGGPTAAQPGPQVYIVQPG
jgi:hypothetical protein